MADPAVGAARRGRVLVVDDDVEQGAMLGELLALTGAEVQVVQSAEDALAEHRRLAVDVVITDVLMAGMSGMELVSTLAGAARAGPAIVVVTGSASAAGASGAIASGATACVLKPYEPAELMQLVRELIASRSTGEASVPCARGGHEVRPAG